MTTYVALLRAINVGGRKLSMSDLRQLTDSLAFGDVQTYIQSGNLIFTAAESASVVEERLEKAIEQTFAMKVPVIARTAPQWKSYLIAPFEDEAKAAPNRAMIALSKKPPNPSTNKLLQERALFGELIKVEADAIWIYFPNGVGQSKLTPTFIDKCTGSSTTLRNFNTVKKLAQMCGVSK